MTTPATFNVAALSLEKRVFTSASNSRHIAVKNNGSTLVVQTPVMTSPFGVDIRQGMDSNVEKITLSGSFDGHDSGANPGLGAFFNMMKQMEDYMVVNAMENSMLWLKKKAPVIDVVRAFCVPILRYSKDKETGEVSTRYAPTIRLVLPKKDGGGKWDFDVVDKDNKVVTDTFDKMIDSGCTKKMMFQAIIQANNIWVSGSQFGMTWKVKKLKIVAVPDMAAGLDFVPSPEDDDIIKRMGVDSLALNKSVEGVTGGGGGGGGGGSSGERRNGSGPAAGDGGAGGADGDIDGDGDGDGDGHGSGSKMLEESDDENGGF
jgi:hypothetical protein